jgi:ArsR family transcriptional regulator, zinc-responsive transcriptional repressor
MLNRLVPVIGTIRPFSLPPQKTLFHQPTMESVIYSMPPTGQSLIGEHMPMATANLKMKKAAKSALAMNETVLRTKAFQRAASLLKHASDPTRLQVITLLSKGEHHVGGLCNQFNMSPPAVSHHLAMLRHGGIVDRRRQGKNNFYFLTDTGYRLSRIVSDVTR